MHIVRDRIELALFDRFSPSTDIASNALIKSSVQRGIRSTLLSQMPALAADDSALLEFIWPKKEGITLVKWCANNNIRVSLNAHHLPDQQRACIDFGATRRATILPAL